MSGQDAQSFIPKQTPKKQSQKRVVSRFYLLAYVSYIVFFGGLIVSAGVFAYKLQLTSVLVKNQEMLVAEKNKFSEAEMVRILELEKRMSATFDRVSNNLSMDKLFEIIERSVTETVGLLSLSLTRDGDSNVTVTATVSTDSFDSVLFQRRVLQNQSLISSIEITELGFGTDSQGNTSSDPSAVSVAAGGQKLSFTLGLNVDNKNLLFNPSEVDFELESSANLVPVGATDGVDEAETQPSIDILSNEPDV